jgi:hypothetical protein
MTRKAQLSSNTRESTQGDTRGVVPHVPTLEGEILDPLFGDGVITVQIDEILENGDSIAITYSQVDTMKQVGPNPQEGVRPKLLFGYKVSRRR